MESSFPKFNLQTWHKHCKPISFGIALSGFGKELFVYTGWLTVSVMWLSGILGHGAGGLVSQWDSTIKLP